MANQIIGETEIKIGGRAFTLRPSFHGLAEIEHRAGSGLLKIAHNITEGEIKLSHVAAIVYGGIVGATEKGKKPEITFDDLGELLIKTNYIQVVPDVVRWFGEALRGDPDNPPTEKKT